MTMNLKYIHFLEFLEKNCDIRLGVKRRTLLYIYALRDGLDLTVQNDVICNYAKLVMFSIDPIYSEMR
jgi:hypothetical protein